MFSAPLLSRLLLDWLLPSSVGALMAMVPVLRNAPSSCALADWLVPWSVRMVPLLVRTAGLATSRYGVPLMQPPVWVSWIVPALVRLEATFACELVAPLQRSVACTVR